MNYPESLTEGETTASIESPGMIAAGSQPSCMFEAVGVSADALSMRFHP